MRHHSLQRVSPACCRRHQPHAGNLLGGGAARRLAAYVCTNTSLKFLACIRRDCLAGRGAVHSSHISHTRNTLCVTPQGAASGTYLDKGGLIHVMLVHLHDARLAPCTVHSRPTPLSTHTRKGFPVEKRGQFQIARFLFWSTLKLYAALSLQLQLQLIATATLATLNATAGLAQRVWQRRRRRRRRRFISMLNIRMSRTPRELQIQLRVCCLHTDGVRVWYSHIFHCTRSF
jgi:hypothetical protein